jgi:hypothetical protein
MKQNFNKMLLTIIFILYTLIYSEAKEKANISDEGVSIGYAIDLLPTILSSTEGKVGYSFQIWSGYDHIKMRLVAAHMYMPESQYNDDFENYELNVTAFIMDWFPYGQLHGLWFGIGTEFWKNHVEQKISKAETNWTDNILTAGIGYVWKLTENIYIDPFAAIHNRMNDDKVRVGGEEFGRRRVSVSASVKIGYQFSI